MEWPFIVVFRSAKETKTLLSRSERRHLFPHDAKHSRQRGLAQFFGGGRSKFGEEVDAENLCLTPSNCECPSKSVNRYENGE